VSFFWKNIFPTILLIIMGYGMFYTKDFGTQIALGVNVILPTSILHFQLASNLPVLSYFTMLEYVFYLIYFLAVYSLALVVLMHINEEDKERYSLITRIGRISYPVIILITAIFIFMKVY